MDTSTNTPAVKMESGHVLQKDGHDRDTYDKLNCISKKNTDIIKPKSSKDEKKLATYVNGYSPESTVENVDEISRNKTVVSGNEEKNEATSHSYNTKRKKTACDKSTIEDELKSVTGKRQESIGEHKPVHIKSMICDEQKENIDKHITEQAIDTEIIYNKTHFTSFSAEQYLQNHMRTIPREITTYQCDICVRFFNSYTSLNRHLRMHNNVRKYKCCICQSTRKTKTSLIYHKIQTNHFTKEEMGNLKKLITTCEICNKRFPVGSASVLKQHMRMHTGIKPFKCSICDRAFGSRSSCNSHVKNHAEDKPFRCELCGKSYITKRYLDRHLNSSTHTERKPQVNQKERRPRKVKLDSADINFVCSTCGKAFEHRSNFRKHMRTHSDFKQYFCEICGHRCHAKSSLDNHMAIHSNERKYKCLTCDKAFRTKPNLHGHINKVHKKTKTIKPIKPLECKLCDKQFINQDMLREHLKSNISAHIEVRSNTKDENGKDVARSTTVQFLNEGIKHNLHGHINKVHKKTKTIKPIKPLECKLCDKQFINQDMLREHLKSNISAHIEVRSITKDEKVTEVARSTTMQFSNEETKHSRLDFQLNFHDYVSNKSFGKLDKIPKESSFPNNDEYSEQSDNLTRHTVSDGSHVVIPMCSSPDALSAMTQTVNDINEVDHTVTVFTDNTTAALDVLHEPDMIVAGQQEEPIAIKVEIDVDHYETHLNDDYLDSIIYPFQQF